jgi:vancomycin resistance protein YoaR
VAVKGETRELPPIVLSLRPPLFHVWMQDKVVLASYATEYDAALEGRAWNIALGARRLDGRVLAPGQELSFNERVGARGLEEGFRVARPAPYLPAGRDAMVAADRRIDLVLRNDLGSPILLRAEAGDGRLVVEFLAREPARQAFEVILESKVDPSSRSLVATTLRRSVSEELETVTVLATDSYHP